MTDNKPEQAGEHSKEPWTKEQAVILNALGVCAEDIERVKQDLDTEATFEALAMAAKFLELQQSADEFGNEQEADGFVLAAEETKLRAAKYEACYWAICRQWPTELTEHLFEAEDSELQSIRQKLAETQREYLADFTVRFSDGTSTVIKCRVFKDEQGEECLTAEAVYQIDFTKAKYELDLLHSQIATNKAAREKLLKSNNFVYCIQYLKNGDERLRAIRLVMDAAGLSLIDAKTFVESLHTPLPLVDREKPKITCPGCRVDFDNDDKRLIKGVCPVCAEPIRALIP